jgi:uncharacterized damage-inducible protein DinB
MRQMLLNIVKYNLWANKRIVDLLLQLNDEQLNESLGGSFGTVRETTYHIWNAESIWLQRLLMVEKVQAPAENFNGIFQEANLAWLDVSKGFIEFVEKQKDDRNFEHEVRYHTLKNEPFKNPVHEIIQHCMNHSTYHRGQLVNYARMLGVTKIQSIDFITFMREKK